MVEQGKPHGISSAKDRLGRISHHFLSGDDQVFRIDVCADPQDPEILPVEQLAWTLASHGKSIAVMDLNQGLTTLVHPAPGIKLPAESVDAAAEATSPRLLEKARYSRAPDIMIVLSSNTQRQCGEGDLTVYAVPADPAGMRRAYLGLKALAEHQRSSAVGITIIGATGRQDAEALYSKFALAAYNFLGIRVASYAYLATCRDPRTYRRDIGLSLSNIARLLLEDWHLMKLLRKEETKTPASTTINISTEG